MKIENGKLRIENESDRAAERRRGPAPFSIFNFQFSIRHLLAAVVFLTATPSAGAAEPGVQSAESDVVEGILFYLISAGAIVSGLMICLGKNVVRMAVWLFFVLGSVALLYFLLGANFLAAIQFIVYVGGTLILLIFGVMLTNKSPWVKLDIKPREALAAAAVGAVILVTLLTMIAVTEWPADVTSARGFSVGELGESLLTTYLVPFEVASVLLLVVMIGAAYLARQES